MITRAVIYGVFGWIGEIIWTGLDSLLAGDPRLVSHTYLWMLPIYGMAVFMEPVHDYLRNYHWLLRGLVYMTLIFTGEYFSGWLLRELIGLCPWHYNSPLAVNGFIRLDYGPAWFTAGLIFERIHDYLDQKVFAE